MTPLQRFDAFLEKVHATPKHILVVGDAIEDVYHEGTLSKIAPEGGAPVFEITRTFQVSGGAANVAEQLKPWNVTPELRSSEGQPSTKVRYIEDGRLVMVASVNRHADRWSHIAANAVDYIDAIVVADYAKGAVPRTVAKRLVNIAVEKKIPLIVDPSPSPEDDDDHRWDGATVVKMNAKQWQRRCKNEGLWQADHRTQLVITNGPDHPTIVMNGGPDHLTIVMNSDSGDCLLRPTVPVVDAAGAGDHFSAVLAVGLAHGIPLPNAVMFADASARLRVQHRRPRPILPSEVRGIFDPPLGKILHSGNVWKLLQDRGERKVVFTNGCFDVFHAGHASLLDWCKTQGEIVVVGINSDDSVRGLKGSGRPIMPQEQRARIVASHRAVDFVVVYDEETPASTVNILRPDVLVKGSEYSEMAIPGGAYAKRLAFAPMFGEQHSTDWLRKSQDFSEVRSDFSLLKTIFGVEATAE